MGLLREKIFLFFFCVLGIFLQTAPAQVADAESSSERRQTDRTTSEPNLYAPESQSFPRSVRDETAIEHRPTEPREKTSIDEIRQSHTEFKFHFLENKAAEKKDPNKTPGDFSKKIPKPFDERVGDENETDSSDAKGFNWRGAFGQSLMFLGVQHGYAILGQQKTRDALKGKFWKDYADSVKSLHGWDDGGRFFTNYIAHPMQGALNGHIYVQNSPQARREQFAMTGKYWKTRAKAMLWTAAWSTQFEIGPISQASIGNVGLKGKQTWEDIVVTPTLGTFMLVGEDFFDRFVIKGIERRTDNFYIRIFARMLFNPTRNFSNMLRFKQPWYRDRPMAN